MISLLLPGGLLQAWNPMQEPNSHLSSKHAHALSLMGVITDQTSTLTRIKSSPSPDTGVNDVATRCACWCTGSLQQLNLFVVLYALSCAWCSSLRMHSCCTHTCQSSEDHEGRLPHPHETEPAWIASQRGAE